MSEAVAEKKEGKLYGTGSDVAKIGAGTSIAYAATSGGTYTALAKVMSITPAKVSVGKVSIDAFDNATFNGLPVEDSIGGWVTPGTWSVKLYFLKTQFGTIRGLVGTNQFFKVIKSDGSGYVFQAYISELGEEIPLKEAMTCDITMQINGGSVATFSAVQA